LKKRKAQAIGKVLAKSPKVPEKKRIEPENFTEAHVKGGLKWSSDADISSAKFVKLSKSIVPHAISSAAAARITLEMHSLKSVSSASGSKAGGGGLGSLTVPRAKKAAPSAKKCIVPAIGALAAISSEGTQELSPHGQAHEVQSRVEPRGRSSEPRVQSVTTSVLRSNPEASLPNPEGLFLSTMVSLFYLCYSLIF
jgi:hypothetical protein